jgi:hypothetical protein
MLSFWFCSRANLAKDLAIRVAAADESTVALPSSLVAFHNASAHVSFECANYQYAYEYTGSPVFLFEAVIHVQGHATRARIRPAVCSQVASAIRFHQSSNEALARIAEQTLNIS